jgi:Protein of unknown function (DUF2867)
MTNVIEVMLPLASKIHQSLNAIDFSDAYQTALSNPQMTVQQACAAVFAYSPLWVKYLMKLRGLIASIAGLKHGANALSTNNTSFNESQYEVGKRLGLFTIQSLSADELIMGDDDKHLNFRISVYKSVQNGVSLITVSTVVEIHNWLGKTYMFVVKPFHKYIAKSMVQKAVDGGRL